MDRGLPLPDRCITCNEPAGGHRMRRKLYSSPFWWKIGAFAAPFVALYAGLWTQTELLMMSFWPLAILLLIAHFFVRRSIKVEYGLCSRHRRLRYAVIALSTLCMLGVAAGIFGFPHFGPMLLLLSLLALLILLIVQSFTGVQQLRLKSLSKEHAWISGTGNSFRGALPELN